MGRLAPFYRLNGEPLEDGLGWYLAGLTDGEACFSIDATRCQYIVKLRDDDAPLLLWLQAELGIGVIAYINAPGGNRRRQVRWTVTRKRELIWLTELFDSFPLRSKKARDYAVWREAVIEWYVGGLDFAGRMAEIRAARAYKEAA